MDRLNKTLAAEVEGRGGEWALAAMQASAQLQRHYHTTALIFLSTSDDPTTPHVRCDGMWRVATLALTRSRKNHAKSEKVEPKDAGLRHMGNPVRLLECDATRMTLAINNRNQEGATSRTRRWTRWVSRHGRYVGR